MRFLCMLIISVLLLACLAESPFAAAVPKGWKLYRASWFDIAYPAAFTPRPQPAKGKERTRTDEAFFRSKDGTVELYIFSPQWSGEPTGIAVNPKTEVVVARKKTVTHHEYGDATITWMTVRAKNKSYTRVSVHYVADTGCKAFGFKYANARAYAKYRDTYGAFKASLVQYAD